MFLTEVKPEIHNAEMIRNWIRGVLADTDDWVHGDDDFVDCGFRNSEQDVSVRPRGNIFSVTISKTVKKMAKVQEPSDTRRPIDINVTFNLPKEFLHDLVEYEIGDQTDDDYDALLGKFLAWMQVTKTVHVMSRYRDYLENPEEYE